MVIDWDLPFLDPRPRHEVGPAAIPLLRLCILQLDLSMTLLDQSTTQPLTPQAKKDLQVRPLDIRPRGDVSPIVDALTRRLSVGILTPEEKEYYLYRGG